MKAYLDISDPRTLYAEKIIVCLTLHYLQDPSSSMQPIPVSELGSLSEVDHNGIYTQMPLAAQSLSTEKSALRPRGESAPEDLRFSLGVTYTGNSLEPHPAFADYVEKLSEGHNPEDLTKLMKVQSKYAIRMFWILAGPSGLMEQKEMRIPYKVLREGTGTVGKYRGRSKMAPSVIRPGLEELNQHVFEGQVKYDYDDAPDTALFTWVSK